MENNKLDWITGFIEGEGCFTIQIHEKTNNSSRTLQVHAIFQISIGEKDKHILEMIQKEFGFGQILKKPKKYWEKNGFIAQDQYCLRISNVEGCKKVYELINNKMLSSKKNSLDKWYVILNMILNYEHLTKEGILKILQLRDFVNEVSKRKNYKDFNYYIKIVNDMEARGLFSDYWVNRKKSLAIQARLQKKGNTKIYKNFY
jgi:hypothetical protein